MKLKEDFIIHELDGQTLLVPDGNSEFSGLVRGNKTLGAILGALEKETTEAGIVSALKARFSAPEDVILRDVRKALTELRRIGAIEE